MKYIQARRKIQGRLQLMNAEERRRHRPQPDGGNDQRDGLGGLYQRHDASKKEDEPKEPRRNVDVPKPRVAQPLVFLAQVRRGAHFIAHATTQRSLERFPTQLQVISSSRSCLKISSSAEVSAD